MTRSKWLAAWMAAGVLALALVLAACSGGGAENKTLYIGGIPDVDVSLMQERFNGMAEYLTKETGIKTQYLPTADYAAVVTAFKQGIAQRPIDEKFRSVFIAQKGLGVKGLADLKGKTFTFGSESSTSSYTMPLYFLTQAGIEPKRDFATVSFSGSHDKTWKLVETGAFQAGVLNFSVWDARTRNNEIDLSKVEVFYTTPTFYDYHWVVRPDLDKQFGKGATDKVKSALLKFNVANSPLEKKVGAAFQTDTFIPTSNDNYKALESVARQLGIVQ